LRDRSSEIADALTREEGKPIAAARAEVNRSADVFDYFAYQALGDRCGDLIELARRHPQDSD
jgi:acyl-CoA reductase-like NAD-dependent aldehyde dehydrogenase